MSKSDVMFKAVGKISQVLTSSISVVYLNIHMCNE